MQAFGGALSAAPGMDTARFEQLAASPYLKVEETMMDLGPRVSRKKQFLPPVAELLESGWSPTQPISAEEELAPIVQVIHDGGPAVCEDGACLNRKLQSPRGVFGVVTAAQRLKAKAMPPPPT